MSLTVPTGSGLIIPARDRLPPQRWEELLLHHDRFYRDADAHQKWAEVAKKCIDYFEGKQWSAADLAKLNEDGRPALTLNKIRALVMLVVGYHINNRTDRKATPSNDGSGTAEMAVTMSHVLKNISDQNSLKFVDTEVYLDGLIGARGWWETYNSWEENDLGECKTRAADPFSVLIDADASDYDPNGPSHTRITQTDWISLDEIEAWYGGEAQSQLTPLARNGVSAATMPMDYYGAVEISPARTFSMTEDDGMRWRQFRDRAAEWVDTYRKIIRRIRIQHWVRCNRWAVTDLETGARRWIPESWDINRIQKVALWAQQMQEPIAFQQVRTRRLKWTHIIGDTIVFNEWSPYERVTLDPFFPYFRRGVTQGMVEPLIDVQDEVNVRRSARLNQVMRSSHSGWKIHKGTMTPEEEARLEREGGRAGFVLKYDTKGNLPPPEQIQPHGSPVAISELEHEAADDMLAISGINRAALGQVDGTNISAKNLQVRAQAAVTGQELFQLNWHRGVQNSGLTQMGVVQAYYTQPRVLHIRGQNDGNPLQVAINIRSADGMLNDVTTGRYACTVDETSLSESFLAQQFSELLLLVQNGYPVPPDFLIDASSIGRKEELRAAMKAQQQAAAPDPNAAPPGQGAPAKPGTQPPQAPQAPQGPKPQPREPGP